MQLREENGKLHVISSVAFARIVSAINEHDSGHFRFPFEMDRRRTQQQLHQLCVFSVRPTLPVATTYGMYSRCSPCALAIFADKTKAPHSSCSSRRVASGTWGGGQAARRHIHCFFIVLRVLPKTRCDKCKMCVYSLHGTSCQSAPHKWLSLKTSRFSERARRQGKQTPPNIETPTVGLEPQPQG